MNDCFAMLVDSNLSYWSIGFGTLGTLVSSVLLAVIKRRWALEDKRSQQEQATLKNQFTEYQTRLLQFGLRLEAECESRRSKDDELGRDIQSSRGALDWLCGRLGEERPTYRR